MWKASLFVAAIETTIYVGLTLWSMARAGHGGGVWIVLTPVYWLLLAFRLWLCTRLAGYLAHSGGISYPWGFILIAFAIGFIVTAALLGITGPGTIRSEATVFIVISMSVHLLTSVLSVRAWKLTDVVASSDDVR